MRLFPRSLKWRAIICLFVVGVPLTYLLATSEIGCKVLYRVSLGTPAEPYFLRELLNHSDYPIEKALAHNQIRAGDSFDEFVASYPPDMILDHGGYRTAQFSSPRSSKYRACGPQICGTYRGCEVRAKDGQLVFAVAYSNSHSHTFFDTLHPVESAAAERKYETELMRLIQRWTASHAAVAGVAVITRHERNPDAFPPVK